MKSNKYAFTTLVIAVASTLTACGHDNNADSTATPVVDKQAACTSLANYAIPASNIGLPTSGALIQNAKYVASSEANNINGAHCELTGVISPVDKSAPNINFQVNLPDNWNNKAVQYGGGGLNGSVVTGLTQAAMMPTSVDTPLKQGYITLGSDSGHQSADNDWGLNDEAVANFGHQQIKKTHDVAVALAKKALGNAPSRFYFIGNSQGGHEALDAAARYPADYDGVVATHPAYNVPLLHLGSWNVVKAGTDNGGAGYINTAKQKTINDYVMAKCDALDGLSDRIIGNLTACRQTVTVASISADVSAGGLHCAGDVDAGASCLTSAQIAAVNQITSDYKPGFAIAGNDTFPGWGLLEGAEALPLGGLPPAPAPQVESALNSFFATISSYTIKYFFARNPNQDILTFDPTAYQARIQQVGTLMDVTNGDLTAFKNKGGKIIMTHGTADQLITERNSEKYYGMQLAKFGQSTLDSFLKFYVIPGFNHGGGTFTARYDGLGQLVNWVENGKAPDGSFTTVDEATATKGRTRPMCLFGTYPKYNGSGDQNVATSYTCTKNS